MKNTIKFLGIIALVAVIGFSMAACSDDDDGGGGFELMQDTSGMAMAAVRFKTGSDVDHKDFAITIDETSVEMVGNEYSDNIKYLIFTIVPKLEIGKSYAVTITYSGSDSSLKSLFPFSGNLTCIEMK